MAQGLVEGEKVRRCEGWSKTRRCESEEVISEKREKKLWICRERNERERDWERFAKLQRKRRQEGKRKETKHKEKETKITVKIQNSRPTRNYLQPKKRIFLEFFIPSSFYLRPANLYSQFSFLATRK